MKFVPVPLLATMALALSACGSIKTDEEAEAGTEEVDMTPEGPSVASRLFGAGEPMPLDIQVAHPNKTVVQLTSLQVKPSETIIHAIISNGRDREIELNSYSQNNTYIVTGDGQKLYLSAPPTNSDLTIQPGQRIEADLVFLGELPKGTDATLMINNGNQTSNEYTSNPGFRLVLPVRDAAFSDDGSKKN
ncbi:hypothetical protein ACXYN8_12725 [Altererythrobacter sp. CAU 1778]